VNRRVGAGTVPLTGWKATVASATAGVPAPARADMSTIGMGGSLASLADGCDGLETVPARAAASVATR
jgi:hypothetical protein